MLAVRGICKAYGAKQVLDGVDLDLAQGESLVVIGGSGTGKSVLLRCILGLETPDAGSILWQGRPLAENRAAFMDRFGMLFQNAALFDSLPVWRNVAFRLLRTMPKAQARAVAIEKLARVGLGPEVAELYPAELSGGMRKRAGLARAIAADPKVIFFDEPTTGLDPIRAAAINALIRGIVDETGATGITITHDMSSVRSVADRVALLDRGRVRWQGGVAEMDAAQDDYLADFIAGRARPMARGPGA
ncbi:phospholipid/cholesterol/gamma-HCH transport system ATP-binding protein [Paracoccus thiocyanatus]|uniref:Phospholipid/cholesterol/gamma-HCH transport system ATP-binding protein n=1 Tax=Paracoccus thiocyanatus TaxID=34006 RepID=A0A1N6Q0J9_9RHOB|nr:ATP-binding cassette domain-containing protein [Paracoccus thiocyanatus]SIQ09989.1 phospholipid/cholesterol/gamma-HCH transport system ATP-binding protein [Paracoccus thiocyanatus]